nr:GGDEF domain-containing protein [Eubacterium sp.]
QQAITLIDSDQRYKNYVYYANNIQQTVDDMNLNMQKLVQTGNIDYMTKYLSLEKTRNAYKEKYASEDAETYKNLIDACTKSEKLASTYDYHIMRIVAKAFAIEKVPDVVAEMALSAKESTMKEDDLKKLAGSILYSNKYQEQRNTVNSSITTFTSTVLVNENQTFEVSQDNLERGVYLQQIFAGILIAVMIFVAIMLYKLVITVLRHYVRQIISNQSLRPEGVYELQYLAEAYNEKLEKTEKKEQNLIRRADYDSLTNLYNRGAFEKNINNKLKEINDNTSAFVLFDIDNFKDVNDNFGHDMGDKILTLIAYTLQESFGEGNILGRIGGDEFAVFIPDLPEEDLTTVKEKIANINRQMSADNASFPAITFSVGISLNFQGDNFKDAYGRADDAVAYVKKHGKCGCSVFGSNN